MSNAIKEAVAYRIGSMAVSLVVIVLFTHEIPHFLALTLSLFVVNTLFYMAFRRLWGTYFP